MTVRNNPPPAAVFRIYMSESLFHVVGLDGAGTPLQQATFPRETVRQFFERAGPVLVGVQARAGSQWGARRLVVLGAHA